MKKRFYEALSACIKELYLLLEGNGGGLRIIADWGWGVIQMGNSQGRGVVGLLRD